MTGFEEFLQRADLVGLATATLVAATPLVLAAMGGVMSERSGVVNIALEGIMLTGAFVGFGVAFVTQSLLLGVIAAVIAGLLISALHALLSISFYVDQIVSGMVINILAVGITGVFYRNFEESSGLSGVATLPHWDIPGLSQIPALGPIFFQNQFVTYASLVAIPAVWFLLYRTVWGLRVRACGEHPEAAETAGINVFLVRYVQVIVGGGLAGLGGAYFSLQQIGNFLPNMTGGRGYIALAAMIFGRWNPFGAFLAAILFASSDALSSRLAIAQVHVVPLQFISMLPYLVTIVVLAGAVGRSVAPAADGKPYRRR